MRIGSDRRFHAMIGSYMDESFDTANSGTFVVGGILGRGVPVFELERRWEKLLHRPDIDIPYFKASECQNGWKQFSKFVVDPENITPTERAKLDAIGREFLDLILHPVPFDSNSYLCVHGVGIVQSEFCDVIKDPKARAVLGGDPHRLAYDFAMIQCAWLTKQLETSDFVSFVCDKHEIHSPLAPKAFENLSANNPTAAQYMATFTSVDEKECLAVQAADLAAFEVRRALNLSLGLRSGNLRDQFKRLSDAKVMAIISHTTKDQLEYIAGSHEAGEPFDLDILMEKQITENVELTL